MSTTFERIVDAIRRTVTLPRNPEPSDGVASLELDSLDVVMTEVEIEEEFGVDFGSLDDGFIDPDMTLEQLAQRIDERLARDAR
jgi:acyl carrier protein